MLLVGVAGVAGLLRISAMDTYLYEKQTAPVENLIGAIEGLYQFRIDSRTMIIMAGNTGELDKLEQQFLGDKEKFLTNIEKYRKTVTNSASLALLDESVELFNNSFEPAVDNCLVEARNGKGDEAYTQLFKETDNIQKMFQNFDILIDNRMDEAHKTNNENRTTADALTVILVMIALFGVCAGLVLGNRISGLISRPIKQVVEAADRIASGHVDVDLGRIDTEDETGQLAKAFMQMTGSSKEAGKCSRRYQQGGFYNRGATAFRKGRTGSCLTENTKRFKPDPAFHQCGSRSGKRWLRPGSISSTGTGIRHYGTGSYSRRTECIRQQYSKGSTTECRKCEESYTLYC